MRRREVRVYTRASSAKTHRASPRIAFENFFYAVVVGKKFVCAEADAIDETLSAQRWLPSKCRVGESARAPTSVFSVRPKLIPTASSPTTSR